MEWERRRLKKRYMTKPNINILAELLLCDHMFGFVMRGKVF